MTEARARFAALDAAFDGALEPLRAADERPVVLFSGGVDSGLLAWELRAQPHARLFTVGRSGCADLRRAAAAVAPIGLPWSSVELEGQDLEGLETRLTSDGTLPEAAQRGILLALAAGFEHAPPGRLVLGQGVDELFLGYAHFRGLSLLQARERSEADLARLLERDVPRTLACARRLGREVSCPYLDPGFLGAARAFATEEHLPGELTKPLFREFARHRGLPEALAGAPKKAIQYGSGVDRWLRRRAAGRP